MPTKNHTAAAAGVSGALTTITLYIAYRYGWDMPNDVAVSIVTVLTVIVGLVMRLLELVTGRDLNGNGVIGNGHGKAPAPAAASIEEGEKR